MQLSGTARNIVAAMIAGMIVLAAAAMVFASVNTNALEKTTRVEETLKVFDASELNAGAIVFADLYGQDSLGAAFLCPGMTAGQIKEGYGVDVSTLNIPAEGIKDKHNYVVVAKGEDQFEFDRFDRDVVDFCANGPQQPFDAKSLVPLVKDPSSGTWVAL